MKPPYTINSSIIQLIADIAQKIGAINSTLLIKEAPTLRKRNRIRTIQASLAIEGNTLTVDQLKPNSEKSFLWAHKILMKGLIPQPGH